MGSTRTLCGPSETVVRSERERTELSRVTLRGAELHDVAGTGGDPLKVMMLMPGVSAAASGVGYPVVRGSAPAATGYFIDGVRIPQLFHDLIGPAVVNADLIDSIDFYAGGAPAQYGRLLAGVIDAHLTRPREGLHAEAQVDLIHAGGLVEGIIPQTGTAVTLAGRVSYSGPLLGLLSKVVSPGNTTVADFWDYQARIEQPLLGGTARLLALGGSDNFGNAVDDPTAQSEGTQLMTFHRVDLRYRHGLFSGELELGATLGIDELGVTSEGPVATPDPSMPGPTGTSRQTTSIHQTVVSGRLQWSGNLFRGVDAAFGSTLDHMTAGEHQEAAVSIIGGPSAMNAMDAPLASATVWGAFAQLTWRPLVPLSVTGGVRFDEYLLDADAPRLSADPRLSLAWKESDRLTLRAAAGLYHQPPTFLVSLPVIDLALVSSGLQEVWQTSAGFTWKIWNDLELSADAYFNPITRAIEVGFLDGSGSPVPLDPSTPTTPTGAAVTQTSGLSYGADFMLRWPLKRHFFGWLTLSVQRSTRHRVFSVAPDGVSPPNETGDLPYALDQTLVANAVLSYRFDSGWTAGVVLHFNTGRPESGELGSRTMQPMNGTYDGFNFQYWSPTRLDAVDRLPPYFRLDVRLSKLWLTDAFSLEAYADVFNLSLQQEVIGYDYSGGFGLPLVKTASTVPVIVPSVGMKARY